MGNLFSSKKSAKKSAKKSSLEKSSVNAYNEELERMRLYHEERLRIFYQRLGEMDKIVSKQTVIVTPTLPTSSIVTPTNFNNQRQPTVSKPLDETKKEEKLLKLEDIPQLYLYALKKYFPPSDVRESFSYYYDELKNASIFAMEINHNNYCDLFKYLLYIEDLEIKKQTEALNRTNVTIKKCENADEKSNRIFQINIKNSNDHHSLVLDDHLFVDLICRKNENQRKIFGRVHYVDINEDNTIVLKVKINSDAMAIYLNSNLKELFDLNLSSPRTPLQMEQSALETVRKNNILSFLFPRNSGNYDNHNIESLSWFNPDILSDEEQQIAIKNIVLSTNRNAPYIVFGPPGTGKSTVLVESIMQILKRNPNAKILCSANSNVSCDMIAKRLLYIIENNNAAKRIIAAEDILRLYSNSFNSEDLDLSIANMSNFLNGKEHYYPCLDTIYKKKVVIATLTACGRLDQGHIDKSHFTHIFIDEAGSCKEVSSLIPIVLAYNKTKITAQIILCGDPKQLGPVIRNSIVNSSCMGMPMIERLLASKLYKKDPNTKKYNPSYIVKLIKNYRSHPSIIAVSNRLFYDNEIKCCGDRIVTHAALNSTILINKNIPIVFQSIAGTCEQESDSPSYLNKNEITLVLNYINILLNSELRQFDRLIGIITTYKKQANKIKNICRKRFGEDADKIDVGTVDKFQGQERPIIILSTVRSHTKTIGFLKNPKRLNVALTRAQTLLIVIGNAETLSIDPNWREFIYYCKVNNCFADENIKGTRIFYKKK